MSLDLDLFPQKISFQRIVLGTLVLVASQAGLFGWMTFRRLAELDGANVAMCQSVSELQLQECLNFAVYNHLWHPQWIAAQFSLYVLAAMLVVYLFCRKAPSNPLFHALVITFLSVFAVFNWVEPGRLSGFSVVFGALLGGLLAQRGAGRARARAVQQICP